MKFTSNIYFLIILLLSLQFSSISTASINRVDSKKDILEFGEITDEQLGLDNIVTFDHHNINMIQSNSRLTNDKYYNQIKLPREFRNKVKSKVKQMVQNYVFSELSDFEPTIPNMQRTRPAANKQMPTPVSLIQTTLLDDEEDHIENKASLIELTDAELNSVQNLLRKEGYLRKKLH